MENVYLYTITEFTHLFVDIKHMRPVTEIPVADLTFWFNGGSINMVDPFLLETIIKYNLKIFILYTVLLFTWQI